MNWCPALPMTIPAVWSSTDEHRSPPGAAKRRPAPGNTAGHAASAGRCGRTPAGDGGFCGFTRDARDAQEMPGMLYPPGAAERRRLTGDSAGHARRAYQRGRWYAPTKLLWLRIYRTGSCRGCPAAPVLFRIHASSMRKNASKSRIMSGNRALAAARAASI